MSGKYLPKRGDRVRVVIEGEASQRYMLDDSFTIGLNRIEPHNEHVVSIEKVEPPVEVFKPGDVVRSKNHDEIVFAIGIGGYLDMYNDGIWVGGEVPFTSERYERVTLS